MQLTDLKFQPGVDKQDSSYAAGDQRRYTNFLKIIGFGHLFNQICIKQSQSSQNRLSDLMLFFTARVNN